MTKPIGPDLFRHLTAVGDPTLMPDGSRCAYVLSWIDEETSQGRSRIYQVNLADHCSAQEPRAFTRGDSDTHPRYSPDGAFMAFLRADESPEKRRQVWLMSADGGEAAQLTTLTSGAREFSWSPDSTRLAVVADVNPDDQRALERPVDEPHARGVRRIRYRHDAIGWRGDAHFHLFVVDAKSGEARQITDGDWDDTAPAWSPDGSRIAFISDRSSSRDVTATNEVYVVDVDLPEDDWDEPELWSRGLTDTAAVAWSPDGHRLLVAGGEGDGLMVLWQPYLYIIEEGQPPLRITDDSIRPCLGYPGIYPPLELRWTRGKHGNNDRIVFLADAGGETRLYSLDVPDGPDPNRPESLTGGGELLSGVAMDSSTRTIAVVSSTPSQPSDLHLVSSDTCHRSRLTDHNASWLADHQPAPVEKFCVDTDEYDIECRLYHPPDFDPAVKYPLVLEIHGGPNGAFYDSFVPWHQVLACAGYLTLAVNPRGSSTYGEDFVNAVLGDWGGEDYRDLMAALDEVCQRDYVDTDRLGVHGYSYGGYMTTWAIGHTTRFRAAVAGAPCIDLWSMYGTSDIATSFGETQWAVRLAGGMSISRPLVDELAEGVDSLAYRLLQRSPITFAPRVETPVLLLHGEADARCPIGQSEQYFQVMKRLGKEVEMVRFPDCSHGFLRTGHVALRQTYLERMLHWFQHWL